MLVLELVSQQEETAAPIAEGGYNWLVYNRPTAIQIKNATGKRSVTLREGSEFGIRPSSNGKVSRMITRELGPTFVFSLDAKTAVKISEGARPAGTGKAAKVVRTVVTPQSKQVKPEEPTATSKAMNDPFVQAIGGALKAGTPQFKRLQVAAFQRAVADVYRMDTDKGAGDPKRAVRAASLMKSLFRFRGNADKQTNEDRKLQSAAADIISYLKSYVNTQFKVSRYQTGNAGEAFELYVIYYQLAYALYMGDPKLIARNARTISILPQEQLPMSTRRRLADLGEDKKLFDEKSNRTISNARKALGSWL